MKQPANVIAQRLLNLYRQEHVIVGGWTAVNKVLLSETDNSDVIVELEKLPTGKNLIRHISNLKSGITPLDSIDLDLLPYSGLMVDNISDIELSETEYSELKTVLRNFEASQQGLEQLQSLPLIKKFGTNWLDDIRSLLLNDEEMLAQWDSVIKTWKAYELWNKANILINTTTSERDRAQIQADIADYETYLPLFGQQGKELLLQLRKFISSM